jgi:YjbR
MTAADFRRLALSLEGAEEGSHFGHADFRVDGRIFATLAAEKQGFGNLLLTPDQQVEFVKARSDVFLPIPGGWGRNGATHIRLAAVDEDLLRGALHVAWRLRIEKNERRRRDGSTGRGRRQRNDN